MFSTALTNQCPVMDCVHFQTAIVYTILNPYPLCLHENDKWSLWQRSHKVKKRYCIQTENGSYSLKQLAAGLSHIFPCCCLCGYNSHEECTCTVIVSSQADGFHAKLPLLYNFAFQPVVHEVVCISPFFS